MLQRSSLPTTSTAELADTIGQSLGDAFGDAFGDALGHSLEQSLGGRTGLGARARELGHWLPLPATWQQYLLACLALAVVLGGMLLHVLLSVQIARADFQLRGLRADYARIERRNSELVYQIAQRSSLAQMAKLAAEQGYVPATGRTYALRTSPAALDPVTGGLAAPVPAPVAAHAPAVAIPTATAPMGAAPTTTGPATPAPWIEGAADWWQDAQRAAAAATAQFWRDVTGRVE